VPGKYLIDEVADCEAGKRAAIKIDRERTCSGAQATLSPLLSGRPGLPADFFPDFNFDSLVQERLNCAAVDLFESACSL
jgi:hypothetical protein